MKLPLEDEIFQFIPRIHQIRLCLQIQSLAYMQFHRHGCRGNQANHRTSNICEYGFRLHIERMRLEENVYLNTETYS